MSDRTPISPDEDIHPKTIDHQKLAVSTFNNMHSRVSNPDWVLCYLVGMFTARPAEIMEVDEAASKANGAWPEGDAFDYNTNRVEIASTLRKAADLLEKGRKG